MTDDFEKNVAVDGPVVNEGERSSSTFSSGQGVSVGPLAWVVALVYDGWPAPRKGDPFPVRNPG